MAHNLVQTPQHEGEAQRSKSDKSHDKKIEQFIEEFKLHQIAERLYNEGITTDFLLAQTEQQIDQIAQELTPSVIQQNKFKYAVSQIKEAKIKIDQLPAVQIQSERKEQKESVPQKSDKIKRHTKYQYKLVLLGDTSVGKSSIVIRFVKDQFSEYQESTVGAAFLTQVVPVYDYTIKFEVWDTAGQERYHSLAPMYYRGARVAICVYDISSQDSFARAKSWVKEVTRQGSDDCVIALVGNKIDLEEEREVDSAEAKQYADENKLYFTETSAKTGENVRKLFIECGKRIDVSNYFDENEIVLDNEDIYYEDGTKKTGCC